MLSRAAPAPPLSRLASPPPTDPHAFSLGWGGMCTAGTLIRPPRSPLATQEFVTEAMHAASDAALAEGEEAFSDDEVFDASMVEVGDDDDIDEADEYYDEYVSYDDTYGDGLVALLQHLSADRRSTVQAWLQLKDDTEGRAYHESTWTNLSALEEDFLLINSEHRPSDALSMPMPMRPTART